MVKNIKVKERQMRTSLYKPPVKCKFQPEAISCVYLYVFIYVYVCHVYKIFSYLQLALLTIILDYEIP